jgi:hypothetical protein
MTALIAMAIIILIEFGTKIWSVLEVRRDRHRRRILRMSLDVDLMVYSACIDL